LTWASNQFSVNSQRWNNAMTDSNRPSLTREERLDAVIAEYLAALDRGQKVASEELLARHGDLALELQSFLANRDLMNRLAEPDATLGFPATEGTADEASGPAIESPTWPKDDSGVSQAQSAGPPGYEILGLLGRGGMGVVYRARQASLNRIVALKMVLAGAHADPQRRARFYNEAKAVARLQHPNIVQIFEVSEHGSLPYYSMEFVENGSLAQRMDGTPWPVAKTVALVEALARAVQAAHQARIIHRDLKPANVLLTAQGTPKIADFGLAKWLDQEAQTETGMVLGTPSYMAPEQAGGRSKEVGPPADVFALGVIIYELLTGRPPFRGPTPMDTYYQVLNADAVPPSQLQAKVPRDLETICLKCLEKEPSRRYADGAELADDLARFIRGEPVHARPISKAERTWRWCRRNPVVAALLAALLVVFAGGLAGVTWRWQEADIRRREAEENQQQANANARAEQAARLRAENLVDELTREKFHQGLVHLEQGKNIQGILELARALEIAPDNAEDLRRVMRANLVGWSRKLPPALKGVMRGQPPKSLKIYPPPGRDGPLYAAAFSPDGQTVATGGDDCVVQLWDIATGQPGKAFEHKAAIRSLAFSPDGRTILAGGFVGELRLWDVATGQLLTQFVGHQGDIGCAAFRPDGRAVLSASVDKTVRYWDAVPGRPLGAPLTHPDAVWGVAVSPDGTVAATAGKDRMVRLWDLAQGKSIGSPLKHPDEVTSVAFGPDGKTVLTGCKDGAARFWDVATSTQSGPTLKQSGRLNSVAFSPDGKVVLTCGQDRTAWIWDAVTGQSLGTPLPADPAEVKVGSFSGDGRTFLTAGMDGVLRLWETPKSSAGDILRHDNWVSALAFSPDGKMLLTGSTCVPFPFGNGSFPSGSGEAQLWDVASRQPISKPLPHRRIVLSVAFTPDGSRFLTGSGTPLGAAGEFQLWDTATRKPVRDATVLDSTVYVVSFDPQGHTFVVGSGKGEASLTKKALTLVGAAGMSAAGLESRLDQASGTGEAAIYEASTGRLVRRFPHPAWVTAAAFTPDGKMLITGGAEGVVRRWNLATGDAIGSPISVGDSVLGIAVSRDGATFLTGTGNGVAKLWNTETGEFTGKAYAHKGWIRPVAFSPRDTTVISAGGDRAARVWDARTAEPVGPGLEHQDSIVSVAFSPDGRFMVTGGCDKCVRFWEAPNGADVASDRLILWTQIRTGMELSREGEIHRLDPRTWQERRRLLDKLGGPPEIAKRDGL
jgi:WD40 repeat protein